MLLNSPTQNSASRESDQVDGLHEKRDPKVTEAGIDAARDRSVDVLRGMCCFGMILVNTAGSVRPSWLMHPASIHRSITFADTLFPCFVFTSGLALARRKRIHAVREASTLKKLIIRAVKLNLIGIAYNNLIPRVIGFQRDELFNFKTYRIPSVLGRLGIASLIASLESFFNIKRPVLPALLGLSWYLISSLRPFEPLNQSAQAWLDQWIFSSSHLHDRKLGFDPEGLLASVFTAPTSCLLGSYAAHPQFLAALETSQLAACGILGMLLTGLIPSPGCKAYWSPTFVGQTTSSSLLYWSLSRVLVSCASPIASLITKPLELLGQRSLEVYLISTCCSTGLARIGAWDSILDLINNILNLVGFHCDDHLRNTWAGLTRSGLLGISMVPVASAMIELDWKL